MGNVYADLDAAARAPTGNVYEEMDRAARAMPAAPATARGTAGPVPLTIHGTEPAARAAAGPATAEKPSIAADVAKGAGVGLVHGGIGALGMLGDARDAVGDASEWALQRLAKASGLAPDGAQPRSYADIAAENRRLADAVQLPGSADVTRAVEAATGPLYRPQTTAGRYAETIGEFAPSAAVGGSGLLRKAAELVLPAVASEGAGDAAHAFAPAAEPYARVAAGIVGGGLPSGLAALFAPKMEELIQRSAGHVTPAQWDDAAARSQRQTNLGLFHTNPEMVQAATSGGTSLADIQRMVEASAGGRAVLGPRYAERPAQVAAAVHSGLDQISPAAASTAELGFAGQRAGEGAMRRVEQARTNATTPLYDQAKAGQLDPAAMDALMADMRAAQQADRTGVTSGEIGRLHDMLVDQHAVPAVPGTPGTPAQRTPVVDPATGRTIRYDVTPATPDIPGTPAQPMRPVLDGDNAIRARKAIRERLDMPMAPGRDPITKEQAHAVGPFMDRLADIIGDAAPNDSFNRANQLYGRISDRVVNPVAAGPVGAISKTDNAAEHGRALLPDAPGEGTAADTASAVHLLAHQDPDATAGLIREHLASRFAENAQRNMGGPHQGGGAKFAAQIAGNDLQRQNLAAALGALPAGPGGAPRGQRLLGDIIPALEDMQFRAPRGSNTSGDTQLRETLSDPTLFQKAIDVVKAPYAAVAHGFRDALDQRAMTHNQDGLARLFLPENLPQLRAMAEAHQHSALADLFARGALQAPAETGAR